MTITAADIKLMASERMTDAADGGGRMTGVEIPDNVPGNLFPKISRVDAVYGRVNLRKTYVSVATPTQEIYAGAHLILTQPPDNERVDCCMFSTGSHFDQRAAARDRVESYVVKGPRSLMHPIGTQLAGQRVISAYQRLESELPGVGEVYVLSHEEEDQAPGNFQYVRIMSVDHEERVFVYITADGKVAEMTRRAMIIGISQALAYDFPGEDPSPLRPGDTLIRDTSVADTAHYFGISQLSESAEAAALSVKASSIFSHLVPGVTTETPIVDVAMGGALPTEAAGTQLIYTTAASDGTKTNLPGFSNTHFSDGAASPDFHLGCAIVPGSLYVEASGGSIYYTDDGIDGLWRDTGTLQGAVDYGTGIFRIDDGDAWGAAWIDVYFVPAVEISQIAHTRQDQITLATRGLNYIQTLAPIPAPGTLAVSYRAQGRWYNITDDGDGTLSGSGVGTVSYATGAALVTLEALPDVGSAVIWQWGTPAHYVIRAGITPPLARVQGTVSTGISPGTFSVTWLQDSAEKVATANTAGDISGNGASGHVVHGTGEYFIEWSIYPDAGTQAELSYDKLTTVSEMFTGLTAAGGHVSFQLSNPPIRPGTLECRWETQKLYEYSSQVHSIRYPPGDATPVVFFTQDIQNIQLTELDMRAADDGAGTIGESGEVIYNTGDVDLEVMPGVPANTWSAETKEWTRESTSDVRFDSGIVNVTYVEDSAGPTLEEVQIDIPAPRFVFADLMTDTLVPGSLRFVWNGAIYQDRGNGLVYQNIDPVTGSGLLAGSVNYTDRSVTLDDYVSGPGAVSVHSMLTRYGDWAIYDAQMRTPGSPLRSASFYVHATTMDGDAIEGTSDASGTIDADEIQGTVQQDMGVVSLDFGAQVQESTLTDEQRAEDWYDPDDIEPDGSIWRPMPVLPSSIRYNSIVLATLPLDPAILGLDPVRLPPDGRVAIARPGDVLVIHSTKQFSLPDPVVAEAEYDLPRGDLQSAWVEDQNYDRVPEDQYTMDLDGGSITMSAVLDLDDFTQPLVVHHRQEDMAVCTDAQIDGTVSISAPLLHDYDTDAYMSSALLFGDVQAAVVNVFDQMTWTGEWSDSLIGSQANAEYDDLNYPIETTNADSVTDRLRVHFITPTSFQLYSENLGQIATGTTAADLTPINPVTGNPYFTIRAGGWGGGWAAGNQLRFNVEAGSAPAWVARTVLQNAALTEDAIRLERRGDVD